MDLLFGLVTSLLVPPITFLLGSIAGLALLRWYRRFAVALLTVSVLALLLLALPVIANTLLLALENDLPTTPAADAPPQAIVVLGGDIARVVLLEGSADVGPLSLERERAAAALARRTGLPVLVTGGALAPGTEPVATLMARSLADDFGVHPAWVETQARDTWENAERSAAILHSHGIATVYVVTHAWHMPRALAAFRKFGLRAVAAPTALHRHAPPTLLDFVPRATAWAVSYYALHEWIGYAYYATFR